MCRFSRPASRLKWGIPFPETFGAGFVTYVWFDALVNYISFAPGYDPTTPRPSEEFLKYWRSTVHVIGKFRSDPPHQRTLARVASTATAEYNTKLTTAVGTGGLQSFRKCVGCV